MRRRLLLQKKDSPNLWIDDFFDVYNPKLYDEDGWIYRSRGNESLILEDNYGGSYYFPIAFENGKTYRFTGLIKRYSSSQTSSPFHKFQYVVNNIIIAEDGTRTTLEPYEFNFTFTTQEGGVLKFYSSGTRALKFKDIEIREL